MWILVQVADHAIAVVAKAIPGYLGEEAWENSDTGLISNVYYWESLDSLHALMQHPIHLEAKAGQSKWLDGYQVVISQVLRTYGDASLSHPTRTWRFSSVSSSTSKGA